MILQRLREETRPDHERLENHIDLLNRPWSIPVYRGLLQGFYGFYAAIEPLIFARPEWSQLGIDTTKRIKTPSLTQDLVFFGQSPAQVSALPLCPVLPQIENMAEALGCAYVLEGASLGGQIITRHLRRELNIEPGAGCSFFYSYGEDVGPMWKQFTAALNTYELSNAQADSLVTSASATFRSFDNWLSPTLGS